MKFSTWTIASFGATMRKYATAFTRAGTLSFVITSCGGMFSVIVRRSTFTIRSTTGMSRKRPGPFGSGSNRPSRKTMPRSYSRATLIAEIKKRTSRKRTTTSATRPAAIVELFHRQLEPVHTFDPDVLARNELAAVGAVRAPELALDEDLARRAHDAVRAHHPRGPDRHRPPAHLHGLGERERPEAPDRDRQREHERQRRV